MSCLQRSLRVHDRNKKVHAHTQPTRASAAATTMRLDGGIVCDGGLSCLTRHEAGCWCGVACGGASLVRQDALVVDHCAQRCDILGDLFEKGLGGGGGEGGGSDV